MLKEKTKTWLILVNDLLLTLIEEVLFSFIEKTFHSLLWKYSIIDAILLT